WLQLSILNEEFLVSASHQLALITSLPFVHTARRYYRVPVSKKRSDLCCLSGRPEGRYGEDPLFDAGR
uniref:Uncharacterized protein n=1 Tax=Amphimedon queenslandica TaxID=400682 RepID=A0A1X7T6I3_AMPQE